jgi:hypothetical protein
MQGGSGNLYYYSTTIIQLVPGFKGAFLQVLKQKYKNGQYKSSKFSVKSKFLLSSQLYASQNKLIYYY